MRWVFEMEEGRKTRGHELKIRKKCARIDSRKYSFSRMIVNSFERIAVGSSSNACNNISVNTTCRRVLHNLPAFWPRIPTASDRRLDLIAGPGILLTSFIR